MKPRQMMFVGLLTLITSIIVEIAKADIGSIAVFAFAGGCVFGKGYGIWEERSSKRSA